MALSNQVSFLNGELDPALQEFITLQQYRASLKKARNTLIGKTGRIMSRGGRKHLMSYDSDGSRVILFPLVAHGAFLILKDESWAFYTVDGFAKGSGSHSIVEADLNKIVFVQASDEDVLVFCKGYDTYLFTYQSDGLSSGGVVDLNVLPAAPDSNQTSTNGGSGYQVEYAFSMVVDGEESPLLETGSGGAFNLPLAASNEDSDFLINLGLTSLNITEMKVYRKPYGAGAYGYIGSSTTFSTSGATRRAKFVDFGQDADFSHGPPDFLEFLINKGEEDVAQLQPESGYIYQQRLIVAVGDKILASRIGHPKNFTRDFPYNSESALTLSLGMTSPFGNSSLSPKIVHHFIEFNGLVAFTNKGVYSHTGIMNHENFAFIHRGPWIIDYRVPPLDLTGSILFVDAATNTVRELISSNDGLTFEAPEVSILSNHLFEGKTIRSWAFQDGDVPVVWVVFNDGSYAAFSHNRQYKMRAWTKHDSVLDLEYVVAFNDVSDYWEQFTNGNAGVFFVCKDDDGNRYIEVGLKRAPTAAELEADTEADKGVTIAAMDSIVSWKNLLNDLLTGGNEFLLVPDDPLDWEGELTLTCGTQGLFTAGTYGAEGTILRWFHPVDRSTIDLEVTERHDNNTVSVRPSAEFPEDYAANPRLYQAKATFTGLDHMEGESVAIVSDGYVLASPNNDDQEFPVVEVASGSITLPGDLKGAIVHIGRPFVSDVGTLKIDTVEQRPTDIESKTTNKVYIKTYNSRGFYVGSEFPPDDVVVAADKDYVEPMVSIDSLVISEDEDDFQGDRYDQPTSREYEVALPGDWEANGAICIRNVDPIHFEILSIKSDLEDLRR